MNVGELQCAVGLRCMPHDYVVCATVQVNGSKYTGEVKSISTYAPPSVTFGMGDLVRVHILGHATSYDCRLCQTDYGAFQLIDMITFNRLGAAVTPLINGKCTVTEMAKMVEAVSAAFEKLAG